MKTGELFIEQVLIGALVLAIGIAPWIFEFFPVKDGYGIGLGEGTFVTFIIGLCFLLGIIFDRLADSLMDHLERHHRLYFAFGKLPKSGNPDLNAQGGWRDPFPEDRFRLAMLRDSDGVVDWMDYHRSRVRLSRALAVYLPGLTFAIAVGLLRYFNCGHKEFSLQWLLIIPASYLFTALLSWIQTAPPRTDDGVKFIEYGKIYGLLESSSGSNDRLNKYCLVRIRTFARDPSILGGAIALLSAVCLAVRYQNLYLIAVTTGGIVLSSLSLWSWWRISNTYREYLYQIGTLPVNDNRH